MYIPDSPESYRPSLSFSMAGVKASHERGQGVSGDVLLFLIALIGLVLAIIIFWIGKFKRLPSVLFLEAGALFALVA
jgi:flagellar biogenesis protein FliO